MEKLATSFKLPTTSTVSSTDSNGEQAKLTKYAAQRARLLFGSFRKGEANDPETYVAAITSTLARYPENIIRDVTHPTGIPTKTDFLPSVKEVYDACEARMQPIREAEARRARVDKQLAERAAWEALRD